MYVAHMQLSWYSGIAEARHGQLWLFPHNSKQMIACHVACVFLNFYSMAQNLFGNTTAAYATVLPFAVRLLTGKGGVPGVLEYCSVAWVATSVHQRADSNLLKDHPDH